MSLNILMYFVADEAKSTIGDGRARSLCDEPKLKALRKRPQNSRQEAKSEHRRHRRFE